MADDPLASYLHELAVRSMGDTFQPPADVRRRILERAWHERLAKCVPPVAHGPEVLPRSTP